MNRLVTLKSIVGLVFACASLLFSTQLLAQGYPSQTIKIVVPYSAGTGIDLVTRVAAEKLRERTGQPVIVENRVGAAGNIGTDFVVKSPPDGHTLLLVANTLAMNPSLYRLPFDTINDLQPVGLFVKGGLVLAVGPSVTARNLGEFVAAAKARPGKLNYASPGVGTPQHLAMELFKTTTGVDMLHVPHKGAAEAMNNLIAGHVDAMFVPLQSALPQLKGGRLRALAVASPARHPSLGDVPTVAEALAVPEFDVDLWYGFLVPARTPQAIVDALNKEIREVLALTDVKASLAAQGMQPSPSSPAELSKLLKADIGRWAKVVKDAGIKAE